MASAQYIHWTVVVTPTIFPGTFPPCNSAHPGPIKVTPKVLQHGTPLKTAKYSNHKKTGNYKTHWNTSHTHLERGTYFIIIQVRLHQKTAWNAAFTTLNMSCSNLALFPFLQIIMTGRIFLTHFPAHGLSSPRPINYLGKTLVFL